MSKLLVAWHHFKTITMHRILVMQDVSRWVCTGRG